MGRPAAHAAVRAPRAAPPNPAFVAYQQRLATVGSRAAVEPLVPAPVDSRPWTKAVLPLGPLALGSSYDPSYDLGDPGIGKLPPVRDQLDYNTCWVFASLASLESYLLPTDPEDFSEDNLAVAAGTDFDTGVYNPGNFYMTTAELARWNGPIDEASDPYPGDGHFVSGVAPITHVQNVLFLPDRTGFTGTANDDIKWAIMNYGAVYTQMYADDGMSTSSDSDYFNATTNAYYYNGPDAADHAVDIVGWDDNYPATNFSSADQPADNGAFIVRNSWGAGWGDNGYFYVSYDDVHIGTSMAVFTSESIDDYAQNFGYDTLGLTDRYGYGSDTAWMAAGFTPKGDSQLEAASFYTQGPGTTYDVYVGSNLDDQSTWSLVASGDGTGITAVPGYHTIPFTAPQTAAAGVRFYVIVRLTTPGDSSPIAVEDAQPGYSSKATAAAGDSFMSPDGSTGNWSDIGAQDDANVCLKVFAGQPTPDTIAPVTKALAAVKVKRGRYATLRYRVNDATGANDKEKVTLKVRNRAGRVVKTLALGWRAPNVSLSVKYRCLLARGVYHYYVYATDLWGNPQTSVGHAALTVK